MARTTKRIRRSKVLSCSRCGNEDDLEVIRNAMYCLPCRTCPHDWRYSAFWDPGCDRCVRALHTYLTFEGPRIRDLGLYIADALRWGVKFDDIGAHTFEEYEAINEWQGPRHAPFNQWHLYRPPHFDLATQAQRTFGQSPGTSSAIARGRLV